MSTYTPASKSEMWMDLVPLIPKPLEYQSGKERKSFNFALLLFYQLGTSTLLDD
jgi:hypothetical protein